MVLRQLSMSVMQNIHCQCWRSSPPEAFLGKVVLKICSKFTAEHSCRNAISIKLQSNFIEIALRHGCSSVNLLHIFRTPFTRNTSGWLLLNVGNVQPTYFKIWLKTLTFLMVLCCLSMSCFIESRCKLVL